MQADKPQTGYQNGEFSLKQVLIGVLWSFLPVAFLPCFSLFFFFP